MDAEWQAALPRLREAVGERNFAMWIEPIQCARDAHGLRLEVPSRFYQDWVTRYFLPSICRVLGETGRATEVRVVIATPSSVSATSPPPAPRQRERDAATPSAVQRKRTLRVGRLVPSYVFDSFVVGSSNQVACQAARGVIEALGRRFNPFFVWGGVGLGKTHLVNALGHAVLNGANRARVGCLSAETFMNTMISSLRQDQMNGFRERFRELDVLILDDVQFLAGKERTQEEFIHTFEALYTAGKQIVLTSDHPPHEIAELESRLRSRFEGGLIADVRPPTFDMRVEIAMRKAEAHGTPITRDLALSIAQASGPSVRELEGALTRVLASASLEGAPLDTDTVGRVLKHAAPAPLPLTIDEIVHCVAERFSLSVEDLRSHRRERTLSLPRQLAMYLSRAVAEASLAAIAEKFGGRDHTSVLYAVRTIEDRKQRDAKVQGFLDELVTLLETRPRRTPRSDRTTPAR